MQNRVEVIRTQIRQAQMNSPYKQEVLCLAVSKKQDLQKILTAYHCGLRDFGENYLQEAEKKIPQFIKPGVCWHFIGNLQSNKIRRVVQLFDVIQSVPSVSTLVKIDQVAIELCKPIRCLLQVNIGNESSKQGFSVNDLEKLMEKPLPTTHARVEGLMFFPPQTDNQGDGRAVYRHAYGLFLQAQAAWGSTIKVLSMGTSQDFVWAIEEGSTLVRLGESLMGPRI